MAPQAPPPSPASLSGDVSGRVQPCGSLVDLLMWRNPVTSSAVFVGVNLMYFFVFALGKSFLSLMCYFFLLPFAVGLLFKLLDLTPSSSVSGSAGANLASQRGRQPQETGAAEETPVEVVSRETVEEWTRWLYEHVNYSLSAFRDIVIWKNPLLSLKCAVLLWAAGYCASFLSLSLLFFLCCWGAFGFSFLKKVCYDGFFVPLLAPEIAKGKKKVKQLVSAIPKMKDVAK